MKIGKVAGICVLLIGFFICAHSTPVYALKKRIRAPKANYSSARLSRSSHSVVATFNQTAGVSRFDYVLNYAANGVEQGVVGSFIANGSGAESRDLYFGTCSKGVCTPHYGITGASLTITTTLKNG